MKHIENSIKSTENIIMIGDIKLKVIYHVDLFFYSSIKGVK